MKRPGLHTAQAGGVERYVCFFYYRSLTSEGTSVNNR